MQSHEIEKYILKTFKNVHLLDTWGEKSFFINPAGQFKRGTYFSTLKGQDGDNDKASFLNRNGVFRWNMGVSQATYLSLFQTLPKRPKKGECIAGHYDFQELDRILPHPVYGWMGWICVLNPSPKTFELCQYLLNDAYNKAVETTLKKISKIAS